MQCPRCKNTMTEMNNHDVTIDVCFNGCGGIWFDPYEFKKMDEVHESDESFLAQLSESRNKLIGLSDKIDCPKCDSQPFYRRFFSVAKNVEMDECPKCGGVWLDAGELTQIYKTFPTEEERKKAAKEIFDDMFGEDLQNLKQESQENLQRNRRIARAFRFLCPSYYIPGNQDWGAF